MNIKISMDLLYKMRKFMTACAKKVEVGNWLVPWS